MEKTVSKNRVFGGLDDAPVDDSPSRLSQAVFILLGVTLLFALTAYGAVDAWALGLLAILAGFIVIVWLTNSLLTKEFLLNFDTILTPLIGLTAIGVVQLLPLRSHVSNDLLKDAPVNSLSLDPYSTRLFIIQLIVYLVFFAAALTFVNNRKRLQTTVLTVIITGAAMAFFGILQWLASPEAMIYGWRPTPHAVPFASFVNQHHFAALMNMTLGLTLGLLFGKGVGKDKNLLLGIAALLMGIALVLTGSRGGIVSFIGVLGFLIVPQLLQKKSGEGEIGQQGAGSSQRSKLMLVGGSIGAVVLLFTAVLLLGGDQSLFRGIGLQGGAQGDISSGRIHFWTIALKTFLDYPILGAGLNAFGTAFTRYDTWNGLYRVEQAHNDYLQTLADAGIAGFICVAAFIFFLFKKGTATIRQTASGFRKSAATGALAGCFGILIHSFFDFPLRTPANSFYFLTLATIAVVSVYFPKNERPRNPA